MKHFKFRLVSFLFLGVPPILYIGGFCLFLAKIPQKVNDSVSKVEAVIVLTGSRGRVQAGFQLIRQKLGEKLFITGVHPKVKMAELLSSQQINPQDLFSENLTDLGYKALNTQGNAQEAAQWIKQHHIHSIRLVTTNYHMIRSLFHFRRYLPPMVIIPHPVIELNQLNLKTLFLCLSEYQKFLRDYVKLILSMLLREIN